MYAVKLRRHYHTIREGLMGKRDVPRIVPKSTWTTPVLELVYQSPPIVTLNGIMREVCFRHEITREELVSHCREDRFVKARQEYFYLAMTRTDKPAIMIAKSCNRDHSTVRNAVQGYCDQHKIPYPQGVVWKPNKRRMNGKQTVENAVRAAEINLFVAAGQGCPATPNSPTRPESL
jgi:hypothetical protein